MVLVSVPDLGTEILHQATAKKKKKKKKKKAMLNNAKNYLLSVLSVEQTVRNLPDRGKICEDGVF